MLKIFVLLLALPFQATAENLLQTCQGNIDSEKISMSWLDMDGQKIKYFENLLNIFGFDLLILIQSVKTY